MTKVQERKQERDRQVALLHCEGLPNTEIGRRLGIHYNSVARILEKPEVRTLIKEVKGEIKEAVETAKKELPKQIVQATAQALAARFDELAPRATERMNELMEQDENLTVSLKASQDILNRSESAPKVVLHAETKSESTERRIIIDAAMLRQLHLLAVPDELIDVTPETPELPERFQGMVASDEE